MGNTVVSLIWKKPTRIYIFICIFAWNFFLRLLPIKSSFFGIDPDYNIIIEAIYQNLKTGSYPVGHASDFAYPYFPMQVVSLVARVVKLLQDDMTRLHIYYTYLAVAAFFGTMTVMIMMKFAEELWEDAKLVILVGILFSGVLAHVFLSKTVKVDVFGVFWGTCILFYSLRISKYNRFRDYVLAGASLGLAEASHFLSFSYSVLIACGILGASGSLSGLMNKKKLVNTAVIGAVAAVFFLIGNWHPIVNGSFLSHTFFTSRSQGFTDSAPWLADSNNYPSFFWYMEYLFTSGAWYPIFIAASGGVVIIFLNKQKPINRMLLLIFPFVYMTMLAVSGYRTDRLTLPLMPYIVLYSAVFVRYLWVRSEGTLKIGIITFFVFAPVARVTLFDFALFQVSTRQQAIEWIKSEVPRGSGIIISEETNVDGNIWGLLKSDYSIVQPDDYKESTFDDLYSKGFDYLVTGGNGFENWYFKYKDYMQGMDLANTRFLREYYENFYLRKEKYAKVIKVASNPLFESGFFSPKHLEQSSYINHTYNPSIKVARISGLKRNKIVYDADKLKATCPFVKELNIETIYDKDLGVNILYLGGIKDGLSKKIAYNGPYDVYAVGEFEATYYFKAGMYWPGASIRFYIADAGGRSIEAREFIYDDVKKWSSAMQEITISFRHEQVSNMQLQFALSGKDIDIYLQRIEVIKKD